MLYLLDANVLIDANRDYYPINSVPEFWEWLVQMGENGVVKMPIEVYEEINEGNKKKEKENALIKWAKDPITESALLFDEEVDAELVSKVIDVGYASNLTDDEVEKIGRDPFLIAYALVSPKDRCVVTTEVSKPKRLRANRHIPDICNDFKISCCNTFKFLKDLGFSTNWKTT